MNLPFETASFDAVVCQSGAMFFPEKVGAFAEARRVLRPGGVFLFSVWDRLEENEFAHEIMTRLASLFPDDPPSFMYRIPHGYFDRATIERDLRDAGFTDGIAFETVAARSRAPSPALAAVAYCQGTPMRHEIEAHGAPGLAAVTRAAEDALARRFGDGSNGPLDAKIQAHIITAHREAPR